MLTLKSIPLNPAVACRDPLARSVVLWLSPVFALQDQPAALQDHPSLSVVPLFKSVFVLRDRSVGPPEPRSEDIQVVATSSASVDAK